jgi:hypothetical protein
MLCDRPLPQTPGRRFAASFRVFTSESSGQVRSDSEQADSPTLDSMTQVCDKYRLVFAPEEPFEEPS